MINYDKEFRRESRNHIRKLEEIKEYVSNHYLSKDTLLSMLNRYFEVIRHDKYLTKSEFTSLLNRCKVIKEEIEKRDF